MKLLHVISSLDPRGGGPAAVVRQLGSVLDRQHGCESRVVTLDEPTAPWLDMFPLPTVALGPSRTRYRYCPQLVPWLRQHAAEFEAVIVHGLWQYGGFGVWRALREGAIPYFVYPHGMLDPWFKQAYPLKHLKKWLYWPWADYRVLRDARAVLFTCEEERLLARQSFWLYRCREKVVGLGTTAPPEDAEKQQAAFFATFPELKGKRILLFLSRLHEKKGCDLLIRAFARFVADLRTSKFQFSEFQLSAFHLILAGPCADPDYLEQLRKLAADLCPAGSVTFPGMLSGDLKWGAFRTADAFVLLSHQENFGIAVAEALACGTPVLISDKVNIWREIDTAGAGLVEEDTVDGTRRLLERWLELPLEAQAEMRTRAVTCFREHFESTQAAAKLIAVLQEAVQSHP